MSKSEKSAYFHHIFANNFLWCIFSNLFQQIQNQGEILRFFLYPNWIFQEKKIFFALISNFCELCLQMHRKRPKKVIVKPTEWSNSTGELAHWKLHPMDQDSMPWRTWLSSARGYTWVGKICTSSKGSIIQLNHDRLGSVYWP